MSGLQKRDVDLLNGTLTVRRSHGRDTTKAGKQVVLPLAQELAHFIGASMTANETAYVCPAPDGATMPEHFDLEGRLRRVMARAGVGITGYRHHCRAWNCDSIVTVPDRSPRPCAQHGLDHMLVTAEVRQLGFHDLRRSHASLLAAAGASTSVTQRLMRHSDPKLTEAVYTQVDLATLQRGVNRLHFGTGGTNTAQNVCPDESQDSNSAEDDSIPSEFEAFGRSDPGAIRTRDLRFRKPPLYPSELRGRRRIQL